MRYPSCHLFIWATLGLSSIASAQVGSAEPGREADRIQEREQERRRALERGFDRSQAQPPSGVRPQMAEQPPAVTGECTAIRSVSVEGMSLFSPKDFAAQTDALIGDCVGVDLINEALRAITNRYVAQGYITSRAVVGPQDLMGGRLVITVFEGTLEDIRTDTTGYGSVELSLAFPGLRHRLLNLRDIEQGVDQLSRLGGADPDIDIAPGALPGTSTLVVHRKRTGAPVRPTISVNNDGARSTGRGQLTVTVDFDSPFGLADFWSLYYSRGLQNDPTRRSEGYGLFVSAPYGRWTFTGSAGRFRYRSQLSGNGLNFASTGRSWNGGLIAERLLFRDALTKVSLSGSITLIDTLNRIQGIRLSTGSYRLVTGAIDARIQRRLGDGLLSIDIGFSRGLGILGAQTAFTEPGGPSRLYRKLEGSIAYQSRFEALGKPLTYSGLLRGQATLDPVFPAENFSLGGSTTVRGFRDDGLSGRAGLALRQQLGFNAFSLFANGPPELRANISGFLAHDIGGIAPRKTNCFERGVIQSSVIGLRAQSQRVMTELALAIPLSSPSFVRHPGVELSASLQLVL